MVSSLVPRAHDANYSFLWEPLGIEAISASTCQIAGSRQ
jgi:hypothetical protein